ncbi:hypothetical protein KBD33_03080 [Candidatus Gracilibacteria bacterium]|nr:hypothetical protein [Candidatus Gracilibacteria bacterium]
MNIGRPVETLAQVEQSQYIDLSIGYGHLSSHTHLKPIGLPECGEVVDCGMCPHLLHDTQGRVEMIYQYNDPMAAVCSVKEELPLIYMEFFSTQH